MHCQVSPAFENKALERTRATGRIFDDALSLQSTAIVNHLFQPTFSCILCAYTIRFLDVMLYLTVFQRRIRNSTRSLFSRITGWLIQLGNAFDWNFVKLALYWVINYAIYVHLIHLTSTGNLQYSNTAMIYLKYMYTYMYRNTCIFLIFVSSVHCFHRETKNALWIFLCLYN